MTNFEIFKYGFLFMTGVYTAKTCYDFVEAIANRLLSKLRKKTGMTKGVGMSKRSVSRKPVIKPPKQKIGFDPTRF